MIVILIVSLMFWFFIYAFIRQAIHKTRTGEDWEPEFAKREKAKRANKKYQKQLKKAKKKANEIDMIQQFLNKKEEGSK